MGDCVNAVPCTKNEKKNLAEYQYKENTSKTTKNGLVSWHWRHSALSSGSLNNYCIWMTTAMTDGTLLDPLPTWHGEKALFIKAF